MRIKNKKKSTAQQGQGRNKPCDNKTFARSFAGLLTPLIPKNQNEPDISTKQGAPLAHLEYNKELSLKNKGLALFWQKNNLPETPEAIIASPRPRHYRTTSKRKTVLRGSKMFFIFGKKLRPNQRDPFQESILEPIEHTRIFSFLQKRLSEPAFKLLAGHLNYIIIRGNYDERAVIFNVDTLNGPLVRKIKIISKQLQNFPDKITAAYIFPDPTCSDYYLENRRPADLLNFKKLFGKTNLTVCFDKYRLNYHPTSFSQVNESMVPIMLNMAHELLSAASSKKLLDLYCGYGLFSHFLAPYFKNVVGIDAEGPSIRSAITNIKLNKKSRNTKFIAHRITGKIDSFLPPPATPETIILDPPRQGPHPDVIASLAHRNPAQVLHIFCGVDQIPMALKEWHDNGYHPHRIVPLDMFPGTANLEILILLQRYDNDDMRK